MSGFCSDECAALDLDGHGGRTFLRVLLHLTMHDYPPLVSGALHLLFRHFSQRQEVLQAFKQVVIAGHKHYLFIKRLNLMRLYCNRVSGSSWALKEPGRCWSLAWGWERYAGVMFYLVYSWLLNSLRRLVSLRIKQDSFLLGRAKLLNASSNSIFLDLFHQFQLLDLIITLPS